MKQALYYNKLNNTKKVACVLCPRQCIIENNFMGNCNTRKNIEGELFSLVYGRIAAMNFDPIEKKPLYHFHPASTIFSIGTTGCNLHCLFCQNAGISQAKIDIEKNLKEYLPENVLQLAQKNKENIGVAFTYNEPTVFYEYMLDIANLFNKKNLKNIVVTNGYINTTPLNELLIYIDAFNVDLKGFTNEFYKRNTKGTIAPVLNTLKTIRKNNKHLEITCLIIPGLNDNELIFEDMVKWISNELGSNTIVHLSRYFPRYKMLTPQTPMETIIDLYEIARKHLCYVYLGNVNTVAGRDTICHKCSKKVIMRNGYSVDISGITDDGKCIYCETPIAIR